MPAVGGELAQHRGVDGQVRRAVAERHAFEQGGVGVEHRRGDRRVVGVDRLLERLEVEVRGAGLDEHLGRRAPDHHDTVDTLLVAEAVDVGADRLEHRPLVDRGQDVGGVDVLDVGAVERRRHRPDVAQGLGDLLDVPAALEHAGALGGHVGVVGERVPRTEHDVVESGERHEVADQRRPVVGALAEADRVHQRQRADRLGEAALDELDPGDQRRGDGAEADGEDAEAAVGRGDGRGWWGCHARKVRCRPATPYHARRDCGLRSLMDGTALRDEIVAGLRAEIEAAGSPPVCLATVLVGDDGPSERYVRSKQRFAAAAGMQSRHVALPATATQGEVEAAVTELAADPAVHGILVQLPLPDGLDADAVIGLIPVDKDVDGLTDRSLGRLVRGEPGLVPCTPLGVMRLLERYDVPIAGRRAVVVGRSTLVGLPVALLLARKGIDATVTMAHSRTSDLAAVCREADILVAAAGQARMITADHVKPGAAVIDVGVSRTEERAASATSTSTRCARSPGGSPRCPAAPDR